MKWRLLTSPYEICMARARLLTESYRQSEGLDPALRNALALRHVLRHQKIRIEDDEHLINVVGFTPVGKDVEIVVFRDGEIVHLDARVERRHKYEP